MQTPTYHIEAVQPLVSYCGPPVLETKQTQNCEPTPPDEVFSNSELMQMLKKAEIIQERPPTAVSLPSFVSLHKVFLVACVLCLSHMEGTCATISTNRFLEDCQLSLDDLKRTTLCSDCLRGSRCCPFCQSLNGKVSLEKRRENSLLLKAIEIKTNPNSGKRYLSVTYLLTCDPEIAFHPSKSNYAKARQNSIRLRKKLLKHNLLQSFDNELNSDIEALSKIVGIKTKLQRFTILQMKPN